MPATTKVNTREAGADVKESGYLQVLATWKMGGLTSQSPSSHLNGGRDFYKEGERNRTERSSEGIETFPTCRGAVHSNKASDIPVCVILV